MGYTQIFAPKPLCWFPRGIQCFWYGIYNVWKAIVGPEVGLKTLPSRKAHLLWAVECFLAVPCPNNRPHPKLT